MVAITGNDKGSLDGMYAVINMLGGLSDRVSILLRKGEQTLSVDLPFEAVEFRPKVVIEKNSLVFI